MTVLICGLASAASAALLTVDDDGADCPSAQYRHIMDAVTAASPGDTVQVCRGTYPEQVVITKRLQLLGVNSPFGGPVVAPASLPAAAPSLTNGNPVAAIVLADHTRVVIDGITIDAGNNGLAGCAPILAGIYLRDTEGVVRGTTVEGTRVTGHASCNSGIGLLVEGDGKASFGLGRVRVNSQDNVFRGYQKAGLVATGPGVVLKEKGSEADGNGLTPDAVQIGFQISNQALGVLKGVTVMNHASSLPGQTASGILLVDVPHSSVRRSTLMGNQTGIFVAGDGVRIVTNTIRDAPDDGVVVLGDGSRLANNTITDAVTPISGVFVDGSTDVVKGGTIAGVPPVFIPAGVWLYGPGTPSDVTSNINFSNVVIQVQGVAGGPRTLTASAAAPFAAACATDADCNDGTLCASHSCNPTTGACTIVQGCDDGNACTADTCNPVVGCVHTIISCDDGNPCTGDLCNTATGCYHQNVADGTPCGTAMTCLAGVCQ